ncbi:MAG: plasmid pRiA4b ORF-3 family protein [Brachybacterium sp.]|uniref:plasmid pRiA4b ORF-3 family protein n=1 Tax=Brachybacterium sp. TaxID=1891286 RepID=UPI0026496136|nr:plasmid pRiA4b ORF-3 family protein [Brachybacterium sp.]MDN5687880.1 plasmid pRiA4b ORF-3 family protein [Brachybacterium sp.]
MTPADGSEADFRRRFDEIVADMPADQTHELLETLLGGGPDVSAAPPAPDLRHAPLEQPVILTVRLDIDGAAPPIWRRLELRSDLTLAAVHSIIQISFDWMDSHLHRFALGGSPFDRSSQLFLCPFDVEEGEDEGLPEAEVRLDEAVQEVGDTLRYVYDYGDDWQVRLKVEAVRPAPEDAPAAVAVGGRRAAPPEDSGGITDAESLAEVLADPAHFDLEALQQALEAEERGLLAAGVHPALAEVVERLEGTPAAVDVSFRLIDIVSAPEPPEEEELEAALHPVLWFLRCAGADGIDLTKAGYMKPETVIAASDVVPDQRSWIGKNNREDLAPSVRALREALQSVKLLRKYKGKLLPTRRAVVAGTDPDAVWELLVDSLIPAKDGFEREATALLLLHVASTRPGQQVPFDQMADELTQGGWRVGRDPVGFGHVRHLPAVALLRSLSPEGRKPGEGIETFSHVARTLAATVLAPPDIDD